MSCTQVYQSVGQKIKAELLSGNAVVLFAYGLSGSGKTFTVFGPDAVDEPEVIRLHVGSISVSVFTPISFSCSFSAVRDRTDFHDVEMVAFRA